MMSKRICIILTGLLLLFIKQNLFAQDPIFSQFYANPLYLNPALAGAAQCPRFNLNYRNQWPGLDGTVYATYSASYDQYVDAVHGGVGLLVTHDVAGPGQLTTNNISGIYAYRLQVTRKFTLSFALQGTWWQKTINWSKLTFGDMIDARQGFIYNTLENTSVSNTSGWDFSTGVLGSSKYFFAGFAADHLTQPNQGFLVNSTLPYKLTGHMGATIPLSSDQFRKDGMSISPNILFQEQGNFHQFNIGLYFNKGAFVSGLWYRTGDAAILLVGLQSKKWKIGYSYDVTLSQLTNKSAGSHEISLSTVLPCKSKIKRFQTVNCPSF